MGEHDEEVVLPHAPLSVLVLNVLERSGFPDVTWPFHVRRSNDIYIILPRLTRHMHRMTCR